MSVPQPLEPLLEEVLTTVSRSAAELRGRHPVAPDGRIGIPCVHNGNVFPGVVCQLHTEVADEMADTLSLVAGGESEDFSPARFRWIDPAQPLDERQICSSRLEAVLIDAANIAGDGPEHLRRHVIR
jgi:hypothetical protein